MSLGSEPNAMERIVRSLTFSLNLPIPNQPLVLKHDLENQEQRSFHGANSSGGARRAVGLAGTEFLQQRVDARASIQLQYSANSIEVEHLQVFQQESRQLGMLARQTLE